MPPARHRRDAAADRTEAASYSYNWAGYYDTVNAPYTSVSASWTQPAVTGSTTSAVVIWVGFDGATNSTVEQCGTQITNNAGVITHSIWSEFYPSFAEGWSPSRYPIAAGDAITSSVTFDGAYFYLTVADATKSWTYTDRKALAAEEIEEGTAGTPAARASAEVIVEADYQTGANGTQELANFGTVTFTGVTGMSASPLQIISSSTDSSGGTLLASPGTLSGGSFTVTWLNYT